MSKISFLDMYIGNAQNMFEYDVSNPLAFRLSACRRIAVVESADANEHTLRIHQVGKT